MGNNNKIVRNYGKNICELRRNSLYYSEDLDYIDGATSLEYDSLKIYDKSVIDKIMLNHTGKDTEVKIEIPVDLHYTISRLLDMDYAIGFAGAKVCSLLLVDRRRHVFTTGKYDKTFSGTPDKTQYPVVTSAGCKYALTYFFNSQEDLSSLMSSCNNDFSIIKQEMIEALCINGEMLNHLIKCAKHYVSVTKIRQFIDDLNWFMQDTITYYNENELRSTADIQVLLYVTNLTHDIINKLRTYLAFCLDKCGCDDIVCNYYTHLIYKVFDWNSYDQEFITHDFSTTDNDNIGLNIALELVSLRQKIKGTSIKGVI